MSDSTTRSRAELTARLNDRCRFGLDRSARTVITRACLATIASGDTAAGILAQAQLLATIRRFSFAATDTSLRDREQVEFDGHRIYFAIDAYDLDLNYGSEDPADASVTIRVMTIMLREDL